MHFLNTALTLALALISAVPAAAKAPGGQHVSIELMSVYPCVKECLRSNTGSYDLESKKRRQFCVWDVFHANPWLNNKVQPCVSPECPREDWDAIG